MGRLQQHGSDLPVALAQGPAPRALGRAIVVVLLAVWAIQSLVITGARVLNEPIGQTLRTSPSTAQAQAGSGFAQSLIPLQSLLPRGARIYLLWDGPNDQGLRDYAYFWASYWLYPRPVTVSSSLEGLDPSKFDVLVQAVQGTMPSHPQLAQFAPEHVLTYPGAWTITVYRIGASGG